MRNLSSIACISALLVATCASTRSTLPLSGRPAESDARVGTLDTTEDEDVDGDVDAEDEAPSSDDRAESGPCPQGSVLVDTAERRFCIDKYEASLVEVAPDGTEKPYPHYLPVDGHAVRAVSVPDVFPQGFISEVQASDACAASKKRLCSHAEWKIACMGPQKTKFPYGDERRAGVCHDSGKSAVLAVFGAKAMTDYVSPSIIAANSRSKERTSPPPDGKREAHHVAVKGKAASTTKARATRDKHDKHDNKHAKHGARKHRPSSEKPSSSSSARSPTARTGVARASTRPASVEASVWNHLNDPALGKVDGALARTGSHAECVNGFGVVDMVGNLHEWVATDPNAVHGTFAGGYYLDTSQNGDGCQYRTVAHAHDYHDYSTGFRCCTDPE